MWMPRAALSIRATNRKISRVANEFNVRSEKRTSYDRSVYHAKTPPVKKNFFRMRVEMALTTTYACNEVWSGTNISGVKARRSPGRQKNGLSQRIRLPLRLYSAVCCDG